MIESFFTIAATATATIKEKGSKFISFAHPVADSEHIKSILNEIKKQYFDATHHCYAWVLGADKKQFRAFDDGEPNHSAGDPILGQIRSKNLTNILVVVVRYFGGTKLGVSGLIDAYKTAAQTAIEEANIVEKIIQQEFRLAFDYADTSLMMALLKEFEAEIIKQEFLDKCSVAFSVRINRVEQLKSQVDTLKKKGYLFEFSSSPHSLD